MREYFNNLKEVFLKYIYIFKKYIYALPLIIYQFVQLIVRILCFGKDEIRFIDIVYDTSNGIGLWWIAFVCIMIISILMLMYIVLIDKKGIINNSNAQELAIINYIIKTSNLIGCLFHILMIVVIKPEYANKQVIISVVTIVIISMLVTGLYTKKCCNVLKDKGVISNIVSKFAIIASYVVGLDSLIAIWIVFRASKVKGSKEAFTLINVIKTSLTSIGIVLYPYISYIVVAIAVGVSSVTTGTTLLLTNKLSDFDMVSEEFLGDLNFFGSGLATTLFGGIIIMYNVFVVLFILINSFYIGIRKKKAIELATTNLAIKMGHIPGHLVSLFVGFLGVCMGVFGGIILIIAAIIMLIIPELVSGLNSVACTIKLRKERIITLIEAILMGIGSFIILVDIIIALYYMFRAFNNDVVKDMELE